MSFDLVIVAVGYESRCRWVVESHSIYGAIGIGLEFGFLTESAYPENKSFFESRSFQILNGLAADTPTAIANLARDVASGEAPITVFVDISSMSREMIANVVLGIEASRQNCEIHVTAAYAPSLFAGAYKSAPIRRAEPIKASMAGWSTRPEQPLGAVFGLGCEPDLALGALQFLEPDKVWLFAPVGTDPKFDAVMRSANQHIEDIFDATYSDYEIASPVVTRGRLEALLNAVAGTFRIIIVPFGPKIFAWLALSTIIHSRRSNIGVWTFSSKEHAEPIDRKAEGTVVWHGFTLVQTPPSPIAEKF